MNHNILVVDPILRASRLVLTSHAIAGFLGQGWKAHLLTRREADTEHYRELLAGSSHHLHATVPVPPEVWFEKLPLASIRVCMSEIARLAVAHRITAVFFTGWNEFFPRLPLRVWRNTRPMSHLRSYAIDYAPAFWLRPLESGRSRSSPKLLAKRWVTKLALKRFGTLRLLPLDERVLDENISDLPAHLRNRYRWIPDPAPVPRMGEGGNSKPSGLPKMLVVGLQTERKGLIDVVELLEQNRQALPVGFHFAGRLAGETEALRPRVNALPSSHFSWSEGFFPEQTIQRHYAAADFVILPYSRSFDCSSNVLATACGHSKPVITTDHGVVGFRVRRHQLGFVYPSHDVAALAKVVQQLPLPGSCDYQTLAANCRRFAETTSVERYQTAIIDIISDSARS